MTELVSEKSNLEITPSCITGETSFYKDNIRHRYTCSYPVFKITEDKVKNIFNIFFIENSGSSELQLRNLKVPKASIQTNNEIVPGDILQFPKIVERWPGAYKERLDSAIKLIRPQNTDERRNLLSQSLSQIENQFDVGKKTWISTGSMTSALAVVLLSIRNLNKSRYAPLGLFLGATAILGTMVLSFSKIIPTNDPETIENLKLLKNH
jgi:hypothetical protein